MGEVVTDLSGMSEEEYPDKTCTIDELVTREDLVEAALLGDKTEQRRNGLYAYPGETFELDGVAFRVVEVWEEPLAALDDAAARREGFDDLAAYKEAILGIHGESDWWPKDHTVWAHRFEPVE